MPFHPACFEIFTRVSRLRLGSVDIDGLLTWRRHNSTYADSLPRHPALQRGAGQEWNHVPGDEFLAANPVLIPALPTIFKDSLETDPSFSVRNSPFEHTSQHFNQQRRTPPPSTDPFAILSHELIILILSYLPPRAIADLRLTSPTFRHLPISFFRDLLQREMPFLWEIRETTPPSLWAIHTAASIQECTMRPSRLAAQLRAEQEFYKNVIKEEMPDIWEAYRADAAWLNVDPVLLEEEMKQEMLRRYRESVPIARFDPERVNWYKLYCGIVRRWGELKGLQNRKRIWEDVEVIVGEARRYRELDQIAP
jgi:hypothetical protein